MRRDWILWSLNLDGIKPKYPVIFRWLKRLGRVVLSAFILSMIGVGIGPAWGHLGDVWLFVYGGITLLFWVISEVFQVTLRSVEIRLARLRSFLIIVN